MTISLKADSSGTFGEVLVNGSPALKVSNGLLELADGKDFFNQGNIVGTVSQSGGIPTGAVVERGSNANGEYVRFADGTQICTTAGVLPATAISTDFSVTKPHAAAFIAKPVVLFVCSNTDSGSIQGFGEIFRNGIGSKYTTAAELRLAGYTYIVNISQAVEVSVFSIGRWF